MAFDPKQCRVLLAGKLMARLEPFLKSKGYALVTAEESGQKAAELLAANSYHVVLLELNLRDIELRDFFAAARAHQRDAAFLILAQPNDAEMIVSALVLGADGYITLPPDEEELFFVLERHGLAAMQRKSANPDAQPGASEKTKKLEEELLKAKAQLEDLEERNGLFEAETARLNKVLEETKKELAAKKDAPEVPAGHKVVAAAHLEELEGKATFIEFLESENDEIKKERDALLEKLQQLGLGDDAAGGGDDFDEPTGAVIIDDEVLTMGTSPVEPLKEPALSDGDDEDDDDELMIVDDESEEIDLEAMAAVAARSQPSPLAAAKAPMAVPVAAGKVDDEEIDLEALLGEVSEEIDLAALEAMVAKTMPAAQKSPAPVAGRLPPPRAAASTPPPSVDDDEGDDDFEDVNTDALLRLAEDLPGSDEGPSAADLEEMLAAIDDD